MELEKYQEQNESAARRWTLLSGNVCSGWKMLLSRKRATCSFVANHNDVELAVNRKDVPETEYLPDDDDTIQDECAQNLFDIFGSD